MSQFLLLQQLFAAEAEADALQLQLFFKVAFAVWCSRELAHAMLPLTPFLQLRRLKALRRGLVFCVALAIVLLLTRELNVQQRVCDIRDWEFASSIFNSPKLVSRGPMLLHSANGSCTITWESFSRTSLHLTHPKQPLPSQFSAANIWFKHNIGLMEAPFGCVWNVSAICEVKSFLSSFKPLRFIIFSWHLAPAMLLSAFVPCPLPVFLSPSTSCNRSFYLTARKYSSSATRSAARPFSNGT